MGVMQFIKGLFAKEEELAEKIPMESIGEWFEAKYNAKKDFLKGQISAVGEKIKEQIESAKQNIEALRTAELRNQNIPEKAKHFMEGNRESYTKRSKQLFANFSLPEDSNSLSSFFEQFDNQLEEFGKSTARPYSILREFFEEEAAKVAGNIKQMDVLVGELRQAVKDSKLKHMEEIRELIAKMKGMEERKKALKSEIEKMETRVNDLKKERDKYSESIEDAQKSTDYKDYQMLSNRKEKIRSQASEKEDEIRHIFASLERPMKKYARIVFNERKLLEQYIENPVTALTQDFDFKIINVLQNMKKSLLDNKIDLKDRQKVKAIEDIRKLDKSYLSNFVVEYGQIKKKESDISREISRMEIMENIRQSKEKLSVSSAMLAKARQNLEDLRVELERVDTEKIKNELAEKIESATQVKVSIS